MPPWKADGQQSLDGVTGPVRLRATPIYPVNHQVRHVVLLEGLAVPYDLG